MFAFSKALLVDSTLDRAEELCLTLSPEVFFIDQSLCSSSHKALLTLIEEPHDFCFISERVESGSLVSDYKKSQSAKPCLFVLVKDYVPHGCDSTADKAQGFSAIISRKKSPEDLAVLEALLPLIEKSKDSVFEELRRKEQAQTVEDTVKILLKDIDQVALDRKRGVHREFTRVGVDLLTSMIEEHPELFEDIVDKLESCSATGRPEAFQMLQIAEEVLNRHLPKLSPQGYLGVSHRVYKRLMKKFGREAVE